MQTVTILNRKPKQILNAKYGDLWSLGNHTEGFCLILDPVKQVYLWAEKRETLQSVNVK